MTKVNPAKAHNTFLYSKLVPWIISPGAPSAINLRDEFRQHFAEYGLAPLPANEMANDQFHRLREGMERHFRDWDLQGIPRPATQTDQEHILVVWPHEQFSKYSGSTDRIDANFCKIFEYVQSLTGNQFLVVCALWLKCTGFERMFICDSTGDEGVDLLGILEQGELCSLVAIIQAKTSNTPIGRGVVLAEYGKYLMLPHTEKYGHYRRALSIDSSVQGAAWNFIILANNSFKPSARQASNKLGVLLRSVHQISYTLARSYTKTQIETLVTRLCGPRGDGLKADLTSNFFLKLQH